MPYEFSIPSDFDNLRINKILVSIKSIMEEFVDQKIKQMIFPFKLNPSKLPFRIILNIGIAKRVDFMFSYLNEH